MFYVPHEDVREPHPEESRYLKMFQAMDMSSNFYFSYSYDVTNTLQMNQQEIIDDENQRIILREGKERKGDRARYRGGRRKRGDRQKR